MTGKLRARALTPLTAAALTVALTLIALGAAGCGLLPERGPAEKLWREHCTECHGLSGAGNTPRYMGKIYADLLDSTWRTSGDSIAMAEVIRTGVFGEMPAFDQLSDREIQMLVTYIRELRGEVAPGSAR